MDKKLFLIIVNKWKHLKKKLKYACFTRCIISYVAPLPPPDGSRTRCQYCIVFCQRVNQPVVNRENVQQTIEPAKTYIDIKTTQKKLLANYSLLLTTIFVTYDIIDNVKYSYYYMFVGTPRVHPLYARSSRQIVY